MYNWIFCFSFVLVLFCGFVLFVFVVQSWLGFGGLICYFWMEVQWMSELWEFWCCEFGFGNFGFVFFEDVVFVQYCVY